MNIINEKIVTVLKEKKLKQKDLCESIDVPASTLNTWLKQGRSIPAEYLIPICEFLNISVDWLLKGKGEMCKSKDVQSKIYNNEELNIDEELILETYKNSDRQTKKEILTFITSKTFKSPQCKLYHSANAKDEIVTAYELERIAS